MPHVYFLCQSKPTSQCALLNCCNYYYSQLCHILLSLNSVNEWFQNTKSDLMLPALKYNCFCVQWVYCAKSFWGRFKLFFFQCQKLLLMVKLTYLKSLLPQCIAKAAHLLSSYHWSLALLFLSSCRPYSKTALWKICHDKQGESSLS